MSKKSSKKRTPLARVTHLSISRVFNTGNYTNVKYEIGAEVPKGASACETMRHLARIVSLLRPITRPDFLDSLAKALSKPPDLLSAWEKEHLDQWIKDKAEFEGSLQARLLAVKSLDELGGSSEHRDAKKNWNDDDESYF